MPDASSWKYVENQFDSETRDSRPLMDAQVGYHFNALTAAVAVPGSDPRLADLLTSFTPVKTAWEKEYGEWQNSQAAYGGKTVSLETLLSNLNTTPGPEQVSKIEDWDSRIRTVAQKGTSLYVTLLPQGRAPFSKGSRDEIIKEVKNLGTRLSEQTTKPALVTLGTEVSAYFAQLDAARGAQLGTQSQTDTESAEISPARIAAAQALHGNLGMLMNIYQANPIMIAGFFDLDTLRGSSKKKVVPPPGP